MAWQSSVRRGVVGYGKAANGGKEFDMSDAMIFRGGMSYAPDVNRLKEAFPSPSLAEGRVISHDSMETCIGYKKGTGRFYAVVNSWISSCENELGIYMRWKPKIGVEVMEPAVHLAHRETGLRQSTRRVSKAVRRFATVPRNRLNTTGQERFDHIARHAAMLAKHVADTRKEIAIELAPVKSLPKPKLIKAS